MSDLLATIVATRHLQPEPVATDALVHLCNGSSAAAQAVADLLLELCPGTQTDGLRFTGQDLDPLLPGRPDLVAADSAGTRLVVEAKFDAELTKAQLSGAYMNRLTAGVPGALVFLVPADRLENVWTQLVAALGGQALSVGVLPSTVESGLLHQVLPDGRTLAAITWEALIKRLSTVIARRGETVAAAELDQIEGLVRWRSRTGWTPLVPGDLPQRTGRQLEELTDALRGACAKATAKKLRNGSADGGPGRYVTTTTGKSFWVGIWFGWWGHGPGPAWAQVSVKTSQQLALVSQALTGATVDHRSRAQYLDVLIPLRVPAGAELTAVEASLVEQVRLIASVLDAIQVEVVVEPGAGPEASD